MGTKMGLLKRAGAWYSFPDGTQIGQGREKVCHVSCSSDSDFQTGAAVSCRACASVM